MTMSAGPRRPRRRRAPCGSSPADQAGGRTEEGDHVVGPDAELAGQPGGRHRGRRRPSSGAGAVLAGVRAGGGCAGPRHPRRRAHGLGLGLDEGGDGLGVELHVPVTGTRR